MKYVKLDVSKSHISLILINTFAWCCKWSLFSLLADIKEGMIIIATTSLGLDLLERWSWKSLHFLLEFTLHIHKKWMQTIFFNGHQQKVDLGPLCCCSMEDGSGTTSFCHFITLSPSYRIPCTKDSPRGILGGNNSFPAPSFFFIRTKP